MPLYKLWSYLFGYVIIKIKGRGGEAFLRKAMGSGLMLWDIKRIREGFFVARMRASDFLGVRHVVRGIDCYIEVWRRGGIPFILPALIKRPFLIGGIFLFITLVYVFSSYIWVVRIEGIENLDYNYVKHNVYEAGLMEGVKRRGIDTKELEHELLMAIPEVSWVGVRVRGSIATVQVVEKKMPPQDEGITRIIASKPGLIMSIIVFSGLARVSEGDTVVQGDVLIDNIERDSDYIEGKGIVRARVWYEARKDILLEEKIQSLTGQQKNMYYIEIDDTLYQIMPGSISFDEYEVIRSLMWNWEGQSFSVNLISITYKELETIIYDHTREQAEQKGVAMAMASILEEIPEGVEVLEKYVSVTEIRENDIDGVRVRVAFETLEDIGKSENIGGMSFIEELSR